MPEHDKYTNLNSGLPEQRGLDDVGREAALKRLEPRQDGIVGNLADLQRAGGEVVKNDGDFADGVELPPDRTEEDVQQDIKVAEASEKAQAAAAKELDKVATDDTKKAK